MDFLESDWPLTGGKRTIAYGGGVQSTALMVLAAQGRIDFGTLLFCNVGDDAEHPDTLAYVRDVAMPYAEATGVEIVELRKRRVRGQFVGVESLYQRLISEGSRSLPIPVRMDNGAPGTRACTQTYKLEVMAKWHKDHGATSQNPAHVAIGFSTDEAHRIERARPRKWEVVEYPLLDIPAGSSGLHLSRADCMTVISRAGLPVPGKSSCWFCPLHRPAFWAEMRRDRPDLFWRAVELERLLNERRDKLGKDHVYLTRFGRPLDEAIAEAQSELPDDGADDEGYCMSGACGR
jgi:hypothetical protein